MGTNTENYYFNRDKEIHRILLLLTTMDLWNERNK